MRLDLIKTEGLDGVQKMSKSLNNYEADEALVKCMAS